MEKMERIRAFVDGIKQGEELLREKKFHEAKEKLAPYVAMLRKSETSQPRLFATYAIAQVRTGDMEGFFQTYEEVKSMDIKTEKDRIAVEKLEGFFHDLMKELAKKEEGGQLH